MPELNNVGTACVRTVGSLSGMPRTKHGTIQIVRTSTPMMPAPAAMPPTPIPILPNMLGINVAGEGAVPVIVVLSLMVVVLMLFEVGGGNGKCSGGEVVMVWVLLMLVGLLRVLRRDGLMYEGGEAKEWEGRCRELSISAYILPTVAQSTGW
ncbi:hypothetical protein BU17DRAFT_62439 [Hysterangium stoloniferum]|nr:hypothetical protein BU17DRAFT_62439 [Hysterangium stoloniferum]